MRLVFIHGWGFDAHFWDPLCALLPEFEKIKIDLGFYKTDPSPAKTKDLLCKSEFSLPLPQGERDILVGHSLGFAYGMTHKKNWRGWIAINGFPHFVSDDAKQGCVPLSGLRDLRLRLQKDPEKALQDFFTFIGAVAPHSHYDNERLRWGLSELGNCDIGTPLQPGLVLAATNDPLVPVDVSKILASDDHIVWHTSGGHILPQQDPDWCADKIRLFLRQDLDNELTLHAKSYR